MLFFYKKVNFNPNFKFISAFRHIIAELSHKSAAKQSWSGGIWFPNSTVFGVPEDFPVQSASGYTYENTHWRKALQMCCMWTGVYTERQSAKTYENTPGCHVNWWIIETIDARPQGYKTFSPSSVFSLVSVYSELISDQLILRFEFVKFQCNLRPRLPVKF
jgi:hypothetical protein